MCGSGEQPEEVRAYIHALLVLHWWRLTATCCLFALTPTHWFFSIDNGLYARIASSHLHPCITCLRLHPRIACSRLHPRIACSRLHPHIACFPLMTACTHTLLVRAYTHTLLVLHWWRLTATHCLFSSCHFVDFIIDRMYLSTTFDHQCNILQYHTALELEPHHITRWLSRWF